MRHMAIIPGQPFFPNNTPASILNSAIIMEKFIQEQKWQDVYFTFK